METPRKTKETAPTLQIPNGDTEKPRKLHQPDKLLMETLGKTRKLHQSYTFFCREMDKLPSGNGHVSQWKWPCFLEEIDKFPSGNTQENKEAAFFNREMDKLPSGNGHVSWRKLTSFSVETHRRTSKLHQSYKPNFVAGKKKN